MDGLGRIGFYSGTLKHLLLGFKFRDQTENLDYISPLFSQAFEMSGFSHKIDIIIPVPLHWRRRLERGFNQSLLLANHVRTDRIMLSTDLVRMRYTRHQWQFDSDSQRKRNVKGAFAVRRNHPFEGKTICLIDDIATSGATLQECALILREAGAKSVYSMVCAIADRK